MSAEDDEDHDPEKEEDEAERQKLVARLQAAAQNGEVKVVEKVLDCFGKDQDEHVQLALAQFLSSQDKDGWTALHFACQGGTAAHKVIVRRLCKSKADVNIADYQEGWSPLHVAAQFSEEAILDILITYLADRKLKDKNEMTPHECANGDARRIKLRLPEAMLESLLIDVKKALAQLTIVSTLPEEELVRLEKLEDHVQEQILRAQADVDRRETRVKELMEEDLSDSSMGARMGQVKNMVKFKKEVKNLKTLIDNAFNFLTRLQETTANSHILAAIMDLEKVVKEFEVKIRTIEGAHLKRPKAVKYGALVIVFERQIARGKKKKLPLLPGEIGGSEDEEDHARKKVMMSRGGTSEEGFFKHEKVRVKDQWMSGWRSGKVKSFPPLMIKVESMSQPSHWDFVEKLEDPESDQDEDGDGDIDIDDGHNATKSILVTARHLQDAMHNVCDGDSDASSQLAFEKDILDTINHFNRKRMAGSFKPSRNRGETGHCAGNPCLTQ